MPLYSVTVWRVVSYVVENTIEIEAPTPKMAEDAALQSHADGTLELYRAGDSDENQTYATAREVVPCGK